MTTVTSAFDLTPFLTGLARSADVTRLAEKAGWAVVALVQASMGPRSGERGRSWLTRPASRWGWGFNGAALW